MDINLDNSKVLDRDSRFLDKTMSRRKENIIRNFEWRKGKRLGLKRIKRK